MTPPDLSPRSPEATADSEISHVVATVWRIEFPRIVAAVARMLRDVGRAEELAQDALVAALEQWPRDGVPTNPGAWLMTAAKRRAHRRPAPAHAARSQARTS